MLCLLALFNKCTKLMALPIGTKKDFHDAFTSDRRRALYGILNQVFI